MGSCVVFTIKNVKRYIWKLYREAAHCEAVYSEARVASFACVTALTFELVDLGC